MNDGLLFPIACYESVFYLKKTNQAHSISFFTVLCFCSSIKAHSHLSSAPVKKTRKACGQQDKSIESKTLKVYVGGIIEGCIFLQITQGLSTSMTDGFDDPSLALLLPCRSPKV